MASPAAVLPHGDGQYARKRPGAEQGRPQPAETKRKIHAERLSDAQKQQIADIWIEGLITRHKHGMELSRFVQRRLNEGGFDEVLIDDVIGIVLAEIRTELAYYRTEIGGLPARARMAGKESGRRCAL